MPKTNHRNGDQKRQKDKSPSQSPTNHDKPTDNDGMDDLTAAFSNLYTRNAAGPVKKHFNEETTERFVTYEPAEDRAVRRPKSKYKIERVDYGTSMTPWQHQKLRQVRYERAIEKWEAKLPYDASNIVHFPEEPDPNQGLLDYIERQKAAQTIQNEEENTAKREGSNQKKGARNAADTERSKKGSKKG